MIRGTCSACGFDIYQPAKVLCFGYMEEIVCNKDDLILNDLFKFEPMKRLDYQRDVEMIGTASNGTCRSILNTLKTFNLSDW